MIRNNGSMLYNPLIGVPAPIKPSWSDVVNSLPNKWSWWHFDESVSVNTIFADSTGNGRTLGCGLVSMQQVSGLIANYSNLARHRGQFGDPVSSTILQTPIVGTGTFSFVIVVNPDARILTTRQQSILGFGKNTGVNGCMQFFLNSGLPSVITQGTGIQSVVQSVASTKYIFIYTFDGTTGTLYKGSLSSNLAVDASGPMTYNIAAGGIVWAVWGNGVVNDAFEGVFDEGIFTTDVITSANRQALYNAFAGK